MILTRKEILAEMGAGAIRFSPPIDQFQLQPHAVDLRLGYKFLIPRNWHQEKGGRRAIKTAIDQSDVHKEQYEEITLEPGQYFELTPNEFVIGTSLERVELSSPTLMALLFPRTSTNRRGINLSLSGIIDAHYKGNLIFPMKNEAGNQVIRVYPGERVCQIMFQTLISPLTLEEANKHGLTQAKYSNTDESYKLDKDEERRMIVEGKLEDMKSTYRVPLSLL
ncbi:2'-deoxycytidine 5'-triphosphate deaminase [Candidatus Uhrbacteria bacterium]|nr:2'-deoxycytidine 5'-triphosphate deaminase [Candidatus Uhrbacteria bacterium]